MGYDLLSSYCVRIFILFLVVFITMKIFKKSSLVKRWGLFIIAVASLRPKWWIFTSYCPFYGVAILIRGSNLILFLYFMNFSTWLMWVLLSSSKLASALRVSTNW